MAKLTLHDLANVLIENNDLEPDEAEKFVFSVFDIIHEAINKDHLVKVKGLGTFKVIDVNPRESVNVNTGERVLIEGHSKVSFTPDSTMKELINKPFADFETIVLNDGVNFPEEPSETLMELKDEPDEAVTAEPQTVQEIPAPAIEEQTMDAPVETPVEILSEAPVEILSETPVEAPVEIPVEAPVETPVEILSEAPVEIPVETPVKTPLKTPFEAVVETPADILGEPEVETPVEEVVEAPAEDVVETPVEAPAEDVVETPVEAPAEDVVETPVEVPAEDVVETPVETPAEDVVETPVEAPAEDVVEASVEAPVEEQVAEAKENSDETGKTESQEIPNAVIQNIALQEEIPYNEDSNEKVSQPVASSENDLVELVQNEEETTPEATTQSDSFYEEEVYMGKNYNPSKVKPKKTWWRWAIAILFGVFIGFFLGFYLPEITKFIEAVKSGNFNKEDNYNVTVYENADLAAIDSIAAIDSLAAAAADSAARDSAVKVVADSVAQSLQEISGNRKTSEVKPSDKPSEVKPSEKPSDAKPSEKPSDAKSSVKPTETQSSVKPSKEKSSSMLTYLKYEEMDSRVRTGAYYIMGVAKVVKAREGDNVSRVSRRYLGDGMSCYVEVLNGMKGSDVLKEGQEIKIPELVLKRSLKKNKQ